MPSFIDYGKEYGPKLTECIFAFLDVLLSKKDVENESELTDEELRNLSSRAAGEKPVESEDDE